MGTKKIAAVAIVSFFLTVALDKMGVIKAVEKSIEKIF